MTGQVEWIRVWDEDGEHMCFFDPPVSTKDAHKWALEDINRRESERNWRIRFLSGDQGARV